MRKEDRKRKGRKKERKEGSKALFLYRLEYHTQHYTKKARSISMGIMGAGAGGGGTPTEGKKGSQVGRGGATDAHRSP